MDRNQQQQQRDWLAESARAWRRGGISSEMRRYALSIFAEAQSEFPSPRRAAQQERVA